jgi:hypothetical protein
LESKSKLTTTNGSPTRKGAKTDENIWLLPGFKNFQRHTYILMIRSWCGSLGGTSKRTGLSIVAHHLKSIFYTDLYNRIHENNVLWWLLTVLSLQKEGTLSM